MELYYPKRPIEYLKSNFEQILKTLDILFNISFQISHINMSHAYCRLNKMLYTDKGYMDTGLIIKKDYRLGKHDTYYSISILNFEIDGELIGKKNRKFGIDEIIIEFMFDMVVPKITILDLRVSNFTPSPPFEKTKEIAIEIADELEKIIKKNINERKIGDLLEKLKKEAIKESISDFMEVAFEKSIEYMEEVVDKKAKQMKDEIDSSDLLEQKSNINENKTEKKDNNE